MEVIAQHGATLLIIAIAFGCFMTWSIGANDAANAMGASVGSKAITVTQAVCIAAVFEFAGAFLAGGHVTKTIRKGIIDPQQILGQPEILVYGMLASLLAAAAWLLAASARGWPVSTTHSIIGAIVGFGVAGIDYSAVNWGKINTIVASWVVSPMVGGMLAFLLMISIRRLILNTPRPIEKAKQWAPLYVFLVGFVVTLVTVFKGLKHLKVDLSVPQSFAIAFAVGVLVAFIGRLLIARVRVAPSGGDDMSADFAAVEKVFTPMLLFTASAMAFAHGSNDVANGIGPLAAVFSIVESGGEMTQTAALPLWILFLGGGGIVLGLATLGYRVIRTIGTKITMLTPTMGFCVELAAAATVVLASRTGLPVSTTQIVVGGVIGVGLARGIGAIDLRVVGGVFASWLVTLPVCGVLSALFFFTLKGMFG
ncbi:MAG: inorganic phosphate transporter [Gammaproteobacteria bacterium]|nr:inorganic phosphate transporter [Gammaproteobacteria bacterium]MDA7961069.1 inorganic phosphate transporter [Gammaproteobacteria bacterium]MDA7972431.1 inorganic phosphate transporter [Gammaproteobacteria bacterium]MDA8023210.1 inorganic phosphate transporter [Gammaproteobacteria bacterium]